MKLVPYYLPVIKDHTDPGYTGGIKYFDPTYGGGDSDGTIDKPFTNFNTQYSGGIPANTVFLFKRGTEHPIIGRNGLYGSPYYNMIWNNNLVGAYGTGNRPIIGGIWIIGNSAGNSPPGTQGKDVTLRDIHFYAESQHGWSWDNIIELHYWPANITVAHCILQGKYNPANAWPTNIDVQAPYPYPCCGIRATGHNITIANNIIFDVAHDGIFTWSDNNQKIVRNLVFQVNRIQWGFGRSPGDGSQVSVGDCIKINGRCPGAYIAGNYCDGPGKAYFQEFPGANDWWKFAFIFNSQEIGGGLDGWLSGVTPGITVEWNTFLCSPNGTVSGGVYFNPQPQSWLRKNLIDRTRLGIGGSTSAPLMSHYNRIYDHLTQYPSYIVDNHIIKIGTYYTYPNHDQHIPASNKLFTSWSAYQTFLQTNDPVGSDINPDNFWEAVQDPLGVIYDPEGQVVGDYLLSLAVNPSGWGSVSGAGRYDESAEVTVKATPYSGYTFSHWTGDTGHITTGTVNSTEIVVTMPGTNISLTAHFKSVPPVEVGERPSVVDEKTNTYSAQRADITIDRPDAANDDYLLAVITGARRNENALNADPTPAGWTTVRYFAKFLGYGQTEILIAYKKIVDIGGEAANYTFNLSGNCIPAGRIMSIRNADLSDFIVDEDFNSYSNEFVTEITAPSIDSIGNGLAIFTGGWFGTATGTVPSGMTSRGLLQSEGSGYTHNNIIATQAVGSGTTGVRSLTFSASTQSYGVAQLMVIRPATEAISDVSPVISDVETASTGVAQAITLTKPANLVDGNALIVGIAGNKQAEGAVTPTLPLDWVTVAFGETADGYNQCMSWIAYKKIPNAAAEPADYTFTLNRNHVLAGVIGRLSAVDLDNLIIASSTAGSTTESDIVAASISAYENNLLLFFGVACAYVHPLNVAIPGGMDNVAVVTGKHATEDRAATVRVASEELAADGATGTRTATNDGRTWRGHLVAIQGTLPAPEVEVAVSITEDEGEFTALAFVDKLAGLILNQMVDNTAGDYLPSFTRAYNNPTDGALIVFVGTRSTNPGVSAIQYNGVDMEHITGVTASKGGMIPLRVDAFVLWSADTGENDLEITFVADSRATIFVYSVKGFTAVRSTDTEAITDMPVDGQIGLSLPSQLGDFVITAQLWAFDEANVDSVSDGEVLRMTDGGINEQGSRGSSTTKVALGATTETFVKFKDEATIFIGSVGICLTFITANFTVDEISGHDAADGAIKFAGADGGSGEFQYSIDDGATWSDDPDFESLPEGTYLLWIRDKNFTDNKKFLGTVILVNPDPDRIYALKYRGWHQNYYGANYRVEIYVDQYSGATHTIPKVYADPVTIRSLSAGRDEEKIVIGSEFTYEIVVPVGHDLAVYDDIFESEYRDIVLRYWRERPGVADELLWIGYVQPENLAKEIFEPNVHIYISASDALKDLDEFEFRENGGITQGHYTGMEILRIALRPLMFDHGFTVKLNTRPNTLAEGNPLQYVSFETRRFSKVVAGKTEVSSCLEVIEKILKPFWCTLRQQGGRWVIQALGEEDTTEHLYDWNLVSEGTNAAPAAVDVTPLKFKRTAEVSMLPPVRHLGMMLYNRNLGIIDIAGIDDFSPTGAWTWTFTPVLRSPDDKQITVTLNHIDSGAGKYLTLKNNFYIERRTDNDFLHVRFNIRHKNLNLVDPWPQLRIIFVRPDGNFTSFPVTIQDEWQLHSTAFDLYSRITQSGHYNIRLELLASGTGTYSVEVDLRDFTFSRVISLDGETYMDITFDDYFRAFRDEGKKRHEKEFWFGDSAMLRDFAAIRHGAVNTDSWSRVGKADDKPLLNLYGISYLSNRQDYSEYLMIEGHDKDDEVLPTSIVQFKDKKYHVVGYDKSMRTSFVRLHLREWNDNDVEIYFVKTPLTSVEGKEVGEGTSLPVSPETVHWGNIQGKPSTFPPSAHTHPIADLTDFPFVWQNDRWELDETLYVSGNLLAAGEVAAYSDAVVDDIFWANAPWGVGLEWDPGTGTVRFTGDPGGGAINQFTELIDTPAAISANSFLRGNATSTALEFRTAAQVRSDLNVREYGVAANQVRDNSLLDGRYMRGSNNLSELGSASISRGNLGLGTAAVRAEEYFGRVGSANVWTARQTLTGGGVNHMLWFTRYSGHSWQLYQSVDGGNGKSMRLAYNLGTKVKILDDGTITATGDVIAYG